MFESLPIFLAHTLTDDAGVISGFLHPLFGLDHLLAMVAVGLVSAQIGKRAIWTVPLAFVVMMAIGALVGWTGEATRLIEIGIALSVVLLGVVMAFQSDKRRIPEIAALVIVGFFAIFHGYAHGAETPDEQTFIFFMAYILGFLISTAGLHVIGALIGYIALRSERGVLVLRVAGVVFALMGLNFLFG